jgi:hypothetical protein
MSKRRYRVILFDNIPIGANFFHKSGWWRKTSSYEAMTPITRMKKIVYIHTAVAVYAKSDF